MIEFVKIIVIFSNFRYISGVILPRKYSLIKVFKNRFFIILEIDAHILAPHKGQKSFLTKSTQGTEVFSHEVDTRDIASGFSQKFNSLVFIIPEKLIQEESNRIKSLQIR